MLSRVWIAALLACAGSAGVVSAAQEARAVGAAGGGIAVAHWDGIEIARDGDVPGLHPIARESIERWRRFAENRGYRIDLDGTQRVLVISDRERFRNMSRSLAIVEGALAATEALTGPREAPVMLLRASCEEDAETARKASDALGFGGHVFTHVETGSLRERRAVDARLAEAVVRAELALHAPFLSAWMVDGLASSIAEDTTGRALVDDEPVVLSSVQLTVARRARTRDRQRVDLLELSGVAPGEAVTPREDEALVVMAYLRREHGDVLPDLVTDLGHGEPRAGRAKYLDEEDALRRHCGLAALEEIEAALRKGRAPR